MRGHVPDMDAVMEVVEKHDLFFIEGLRSRVLHDMGRTPLGTFGHIGCFSTQSSKGMRR